MSLHEIHDMTLRDSRMTRKPAMILIIPTRGSEAVAPETPVAGLPLLRRIVVTASRAGCDNILVLDAGPPGLARLLEGTGAAVVPLGQLADHHQSRRIVLLASDLIPHRLLLKHLLEIPLPAGTMLAPTSGIVVVETLDPRPLLTSIAADAVDGGSVFPELARSLNRAQAGSHGNGTGDLLTEGRGWIHVRTRKDLSSAERWLLRGLIKETEGCMSRHVNRKVSLAITRRLLRTDITPNQMTALSVLVGLVGAVFFLSSTPAYQLSGALLFLAHSILDGCDGEIARLKYLESRLGGILDFWGDNLVHVAVFACIGLGWQRAVESSFPLVLAFSAAAGTLLSAGVVYRKTMHTKPAEGPLFTSVTHSETSTRLTTLADALARRDFIYLVVILSAFGRARWFLMLAAIGAPLFFFMLLWISRREGVQA